MSNIRRQKILDPKSGVLLHEVIKPAMYLANQSDLTRLNFSEDSEYLQGAFLQIPQNYDFRAHEHLERNRSFTNLRAQEAWVVISGEVEVDYFSEDGTFMESVVLKAGDVTITFRGGHAYRTKESSAIVYEFKSGPYEGQDIDKKFI
jgi:mannose-6-phosphate isomerase-like protein (cupin superfamily)